MPLMGPVHTRERNVFCGPPPHREGWGWLLGYVGCPAVVCWGYLPHLCSRRHRPDPLHQQAVALLPEDQDHRYAAPFFANHVNAVGAFFFVFVKQTSRFSDVPIFHLSVWWMTRGFCGEPGLGQVATDAPLFVGDPLLVGRYSLSVAHRDLSQGSSWASSVWHWPAVCSQV